MLNLLECFMDDFELLSVLFFRSCVSVKLTNQCQRPSIICWFLLEEIWYKYSHTAVFHTVLDIRWWRQPPCSISVFRRWVWRSSRCDSVVWVETRVPATCSPRNSQDFKGRFKPEFTAVPKQFEDPCKINDSSSVSDGNEGHVTKNTSYESDRQHKNNSERFKSLHDFCFPSIVPKNIVPIRNV